MKDVQCYELFGGIALKNHAFSFSLLRKRKMKTYSDVRLLLVISMLTVGSLLRKCIASCLKIHRLSTAIAS